MRRLERDDGTRDGELEMDGELFDEPIDTLAVLAGPEASLEVSLDDLAPWQRLGDVLGQITGEAATD